MTDEPGTPAQDPQCADTGCDIPADQRVAHPQWGDRHPHHHGGDGHGDDGHGDDGHGDDDCPCGHD
ncbi:hypothetical protein ACWDUI_12080 [Streptosporangium sandarakinum]|uniref:hypothetical protein n=1 Tax=Streptosporangium sandarakinum TaxID=1260955 RepID=UPI0036C39757